MRFFVGVTDGDWYRFLAARPHLGEANFWQPGGNRVFKALSPGEPFLFKTHYRDGNLIVGGGFFSGSDLLPLRQAWRFFREKNGVPSLEQLQMRAARYRNEKADTRYDPTIGCVFLTDVRFFEQPSVSPSLDDFAKNIVTGKRFTAEQLDDGHPLLLALNEFMAPEINLLAATGTVPGRIFGDPRLVRPRLGQGSFKALVLSAYDRHCAITGDKIVPVLEAAHIRPVSEGGEHRVDNGLLLRSDVHTLFDDGYLSVDPKYRLRVSPVIRKEFANGEDFYRRAGTEILLPRRHVDRPNRQFLEWHNDVIFRTSAD